MAEQSGLFSTHSSVVLVDEQIAGLVDKGSIIDRKTFDRTSLESCSYDIRVGSLGVVGGTGREQDLENSNLDLPPGGYAGLVSWEKIILPKDVFARLGAKRSYSYDGIILLTGAMVDPGYVGHLLFGVYNASQKRYVLRRGAKICSIIFEQLPEEVERDMPAHPDLLHGRIPDDFINKMANMEVLPWMQISEKVKQIEQITADIFDLKKRYQDVLEPIKELTSNVDRISQDVDKLADHTTELKEATRANADQLHQVSLDLSTITGQLNASVRTAQRAEEKVEQAQSVIGGLAAKVGRYGVVISIVFGIVCIILGAMLAPTFQKLFGS